MVILIETMRLRTQTFRNRLGKPYIFDVPNAVGYFLLDLPDRPFAEVASRKAPSELLRSARARGLRGSRPAWTRSREGIGQVVKIHLERRRKAQGRGRPRCRVLSLFFDEESSLIEIVWAFYMRRRTYGAIAKEYRVSREWIKQQIRRLNRTALLHL